MQYGNDFIWFDFFVKPRLNFDIWIETASLVKVQSGKAKRETVCLSPLLYRLIDSPLMTCKCYGTVPVECPCQGKVQLPPVVGGGGGGGEGVSSYFSKLILKNKKKNGSTVSAEISNVDFTAFPISFQPF